MKKWSEEAWDVARPTYLKIIEHPFVEELARGTLAADKFLFYLRQDSLYLAHYSRVLTHIASRLTEKEHIAAFIRFASDGIEVEEALHALLGLSSFSRPWIASGRSGRLRQGVHQCRNHRRSRIRNRQGSRPCAPFLQLLGIRAGQYTETAEILCEVGIFYENIPIFAYSNNVQNTKKYVNGFQIPNVER